MHSEHSTPFRLLSDNIITHIFHLCSIFFKFWYNFYTNFGLKNYAKKHFFLFPVNYPENGFIPPSFLSSLNMKNSAFVLIRIQRTLCPICPFLCNCYLCVTLPLFFTRITFVQRKNPTSVGSSAYFFLNNPLMSNPRFCSLSSSAVSEINSIYLPVPMATQLTASSATMA